MNATRRGEVRALLMEYYDWLDANPQWQNAPLWRVPIPPHLSAIALAEYEVRTLYGDPTAEPPRGILSVPAE